MACRSKVITQIWWLSCTMRSRHFRPSATVIMSQSHKRKWSFPSWSSWWVLLSSRGLWRRPVASWNPSRPRSTNKEACSAGSQFSRKAFYPTGCCRSVCSRTLTASCSISGAATAKSACATKLSRRSSIAFTAKLREWRGTLGAGTSTNISWNALSPAWCSHITWIAKNQFFRSRSASN